MSPKGPWTQESLVVTKRSDLVVIGGGIVGLATAYAYQQRFPDDSIVLLEKEPQLALHQTGRNSGVIHAGIYYKPGSLKAKNCTLGKQLLEQFCTEAGILFKRCGKVVVACSDDELPALQNIFERGTANGVQCRLVGPEEIHEREPHVRAVKGIIVPETGVVNYRDVCAKLAERLRSLGVEITCNARVGAITREQNISIIESEVGEFRARTVVNCAGVYSDKIGKDSGKRSELQIVPFRGEYYIVKPEFRELCRTLIYPVPDPRFPFLGVHFTRGVDDEVECGPNAVLAFGREAYKWHQINFAELGETLAYKGFRKLALRYWRTGLGEMWRSLSKAAFVRALQRLVPDVRAEHLEPGPAGIRAQAVSIDGSTVDDFVIDDAPGIVHVRNAPSPAATSSLQIGRTIVERVVELRGAS